LTLQRRLGPQGTCCRLRPPNRSSETNELLVRYDVTILVKVSPGRMVPPLITFVLMPRSRKAAPSPVFTNRTASEPNRSANLAHPR